LADSTELLADALVEADALADALADVEVDGAAERDVTVVAEVEASPFAPFGGRCGRGVQCASASGRTSASSGSA
jgi:hypothetical protein